MATASKDDLPDRALYPVPSDWAARAHVDAAGYERLYRESMDAPDAFWLEQAKRLDWMKAPSVAGNCSFDEGDFGIKWFEDGVLNVSFNCIDRHLESRGDQIAILWEPDSPDGAVRRFTYRELYAEVCRFANVLKAQGVTKGDRVTVYLPMLPEAAFAVLACARIGAIHSVVFGGFSPDALANRINDSEAKVVITADWAPRGGKKTPLKGNADQALLVLERRSEISALLTDIDMPGSMSGLGLAAVVAERWPACKILVISGRHAPDPECLARGASFIAKPVTEAGLLRVLQRMALID